MSERDFSQEEENFEAEEVQESTEVPEARELEQATQEPEAHVEATRGYEEAEQIETSVTELVETGDQVAHKDDPPNPPQGSEEISATPITLPGQSKEDEGASPIPLPEPVDLETAIDPEDLVAPIPPTELPVEDSTEELVGMKFKEEDEVRDPIPPTEMPPEVEIKDDVEIFKQEEEVDPKYIEPVPHEESHLSKTVSDPTEEVEGLPVPLPYPKDELQDLSFENLEEHNRIPTEMPPEVELVDEVDMVKQEEEVDFKFFKPVPVEELEQSDMPPAEMPPEVELTDEVDMVKQEEEVEWKFYTPVPDEDMEITDVPPSNVLQDDESKIPALDGSSVIDPTLDEGFVKGVPEESEDDDQEEELQT